MNWKILKNIILFFVIILALVIGYATGQGAKVLGVMLFVWIFVIINKEVKYGGLKDLDQKRVDEILQNKLKIKYPITLEIGVVLFAMLFVFMGYVFRSVLFEPTILLIFIIPGALVFISLAGVFNVITVSKEGIKIPKYLVSSKLIKWEDVKSAKLSYSLVGRQSLVIEAADLKIKVKAMQRNYDVLI